VAARAVGSRQNSTVQESDFPIGATFSHYRVVGELKSFHEDPQDGWSEKTTGPATADGLVRRRSRFGKRLPQLGKSAM